MDHLLYIAMSGAKETMNSLAVRGNNLANANTTGFKSDFEQARSMQAFGEGLPSRVFAMAERPGQNLQHGMLMTTGRDLDVAVDGPGWIAVQDPKGGEAYTRMGNLQVNATGNLQSLDRPECGGRRGSAYRAADADGETRDQSGWHHQWSTGRGCRQLAGRFPADQAGQPGRRCGGEGARWSVSPQGWPRMKPPGQCRPDCRLP